MKQYEYSLINFFPIAAALSEQGEINIVKIKAFVTGAIVVRLMVILQILYSVSIYKVNRWILARKLYSVCFREIMWQFTYHYKDFGCNTLEILTGRPCTWRCNWQMQITLLLRASQLTTPDSLKIFRWSICMNEKRNDVQ